MEANDAGTKQKVHLLLKISSPDFWSKNYALHPKKSRVSNYLWIHERYLGQLSALKDLRNKEELKTKFVKFAAKLSGHAHFEDAMMFKFLKENGDLDASLLEIVEQLSEEHNPAHKKVAKIVEEFDTLSLEDVIKAIAEFEKPLIQHFTKEDQDIVPVMLNLNNALYKKYRSYLSWKYYFMY
eukprot:UN09566